MTLGLRQDPAEDLVRFAAYFNTPIVTLPVRPQGSQQLGDQDASPNFASIRTPEELQHVLEADGIDASLFGTGKAKTIKALLKECMEGSSFLERNELTGKVQRVVEPVFIQLRWKNLVLVEGTQILEDGRERKRNMILAEKKDRDDPGIAFTSIRGVFEELGVPIEVLQGEGIVRFREDLYCFEVEKLDSASYPGLPCIYRTHYTQLDILETGLHVFEKFALPPGDPFETDETSSLGTKKHFWNWLDVDDARAAKVKKFPPELTRTASPTMQEDAKDLKKIQTVEDLKLVLEQDGVDTSKFGEGKAKTLQQLLNELLEQSSQLERASESSKVQRVVEPVFIRLKWHDLVLFEREQEVDGKRKKRNMLLAEKKEPRDDDVFATCIRGLYEEIGLSKEELLAPGVLSFREDLYCCRTEHMDSASYPGLPCVYRTHYAEIDILDGGVEKFAFMGLPEGKDVSTMEGKRTHYWGWCDMQKARQDKIKGLQLSASIIDPAANPPESVEALRTILREDSIALGAWGVGKARTLEQLFQEIATKACILERAPTTGRLMRVLEVAQIVFRWHGDELIQAEDPEQDPKVLNRQNSVGKLFDVASESRTNCVASSNADLASLLQQSGNELELSHSEPTSQDDLAGEKLVKRKVSNSSMVRRVSSVPGASSEEYRDSPGRVKFREDLNCFEVENYESASFPGLHCVYRTKHVHLEQRNTMDILQQIDE